MSSRPLSPLLAALVVAQASPAEAEDVPAPFGEVTTEARFGHDELAGQIAKGRAQGAEAGLRVMARPESWRAGKLLEDFSFGVGAEMGWTARVPRASAPTALQPYDVAPNGYLYGGFRLELLGARDRLTLRYAIGATGDSSRADELYGTLGDLGGWDHAAEGEIAQNLWLHWEHQWLEAMPTRLGTHLVDLSSEAITALGERRVSQTFALTTRVGWLLGPLPGTTAQTGQDDWAHNAEAYVYGTLALDLVAHDALIDGPFFNDAPHPYAVDSRAFVPHATVGVALRPWRAIGLGYALDIRAADTALANAAPPEQPAPAGQITGRLHLDVAF